MERVDYCYVPGFPALINASIRITAGERIALLGPNGCGKSTLLHLLDGLIFPSSGTIEALGMTLTENLLDQPHYRQQFRSRISFLFQDSEIQLFSTTVRDELAFGPIQLGMKANEVAGRVNDLLDIFQLTGLADRSPLNLSGGEKKRVAMASIMATAPDILLLDEPTSGLDPRSKRWLTTFLLDLAETGRTIVLATHDLGLAESIANRGIILDEHHRIVADMPISRLLADRALLASCNLIEPPLTPSTGTTQTTSIPAPYPFTAPCKKRPF
jgi:cobalt/nickel transport system ATP-binding protein